VEDNLWLGHEHDKSKTKTASLLEKLRGVVGEQFAASVLVSSLSPSERQLVEFLKALSLSPELLILDEATASLDSKQVERVFTVVHELRQQGVGVVIVTHRMAEIERLADEVTVLRNGVVVGRSSLAETTREALVRLIAGEAGSALGEEKTKPTQTMPVRLSAKLEPSTKLKNIEFSLQQGEILGLGGLQGQGQSELLLTLFGALPMQGTLTLEQQSVRFSHPQNAMQHGVAYVPGDRNREGLLASRSIFENALLSAWGRHNRLWGLDLKNAKNAALEVTERLKLKYGTLEDNITSLSGGNAQKVVIGKWLLCQPRVLLLDDPTKGIDVGAKAEFYHLLSELSQAGISVMFYSSDEDELLSLCNRVLVMLEGRIVKELTNETLTRASLIRASLGEG
jgi:ribose transport system ATP-binding protein